MSAGGPRLPQSAPQAPTLSASSEPVAAESPETLSRDDVPAARKAKSRKPTAPQLRAAIVGALLPLLLVFLVAFPIYRHFEGTAASVGLGSSLAVVLGVARFLWKTIDEKTFLRKLGQLLITIGTSRKLIVRMAFIGLGLGIGGSLFASAHVEGLAKDFEGPNSGIWIYRMVAPSDAPFRAAKADSVRLEQTNVHGHFLMLPQFGKRTWLLSSTFLRTPDARMLPWSTERVGFPGSFDRVPSLAVLLVQKFVTEIAPARPLHVVIRDDSSNVQIGFAALRDPRAIPSLVLSLAPPPRPDSATVAHWQLALMKVFRADSLPMHVRGWKDSLVWMPPQGHLARGQRLRVEVTRHEGTVLASRIVILNEPNSHVLLHPPN